MTFPAEFVDPQSVVISSKTHNQTANGHGGKSYVAQIGDPQYFCLDITTPSLEYTDCMALFAFAVSLRGQFGRCTYRNPLPPLGSGIGSNSKARTSVVAMQTSVPISGAIAAKTNALKVGDLIQFANHRKVYMITQNVSTNGVGQSTLHFTPSLRTAISRNTHIYAGREVHFQLSLKTDVTKLNLEATKTSQKITLQFEEIAHD